MRGAREHPDMAVLTGAELDEAIEIALERIKGKNQSTELASVAADISLPSDRYWTAVYVMIIALADGKTDWREVEFLESLRSTFDLSEKQMDVAMQTAAQFPAIDLGGAPPA
jgi:hypothetical protein